MVRDIPENIADCSTLPLASLVDASPVLCCPSGCALAVQESMMENLWSALDEVTNSNCLNSAMVVMREMEGHTLYTCKFSLSRLNS